jgi:hypothetical protein
VPETPGPQSHFHVIWEPTLQSVDINGGVEEQFRERGLELREEGQLGTIAIQEPLMIFLRF